MVNLTNWHKTTHLPPIKIPNGSVEALKWLAMLAMTVDHANRFFFAGRIYAAYCIGRIAMPLFAFILAYNLARPNLSTRIYSQTLKRLTVFGLLAIPGYTLMKSMHWLPLNIMFTLWIATASIYFLNKGEAINNSAAILVFFMGGIFVEYNWPGVAFCITSWYFCKKPSLFTLFLALFSCLWISSINGNNWAMAAIPIIFVATMINVPIPRIRYFFYLYYPLHLTLFSLIKIL